VGSSLLITGFPIVDNWLRQQTIAQQKIDKHNGAVIAPELARQFARRKEKNR
jgi:hypothetical protein